MNIKLIHVILILWLAPLMLFAQSNDSIDYYNISSDNIINDNPDSAYIYAKRALLLSQQNKYKYGTGKALYNLGTYYYYIDDYKQGILKLKDAINIFTELDNQVEIGICYGMIGEIYVYKAENEKALEYLDKCRRILEDNKESINLARCYNNIGEIYKNQLNYNEAIVFYKKAYSIGDDIRKGDASLNLGTAYLLKEDYLNAETSLRNAIKLANINNDNYVLSSAYCSIGELYTNYGKIDTALYYLISALTIKEELEDQHGITQTSNNIGGLYLHINNIKEAFPYFLKAKNIAEEIGVKDELKESYLGLSNLYHIRGNDDSAYYYLSKFNTLYKEILSKETIKKLSLLENTFKEEKRRNEEKSQRIVNNIIRTFSVVVIIILIAFVYILFNKYKLKTKANIEIQNQKSEIEEMNKELNIQNKEISQSIDYAKRIQTAILPKSNVLNQHVSEHFVLFKPKDKVSGDFYWWTVVENHIVITVADCTGHGVPGAFMSILGTSFLREIVIKEYMTNPVIILKRLRKEIIHVLNQKGVSGEQKDGMDMALVSINTETLELQYAGAYNPLYIISSINNKLIELKPDKMPIAIHENMGQFTIHEYQLQKGDLIYLLSDGYIDQFGGPKDKRFMSKQFKNLLVNNSNKSMAEQYQLLENTLTEWTGNGEQTDDITIIGIKI